MRCERMRMAAGGAETLAAELRALVAGPASVSAAVGEIVEAVRAEGDAAVRRLSARFDTGGAAPPALRVQPAELQAAAERLPPEVRRGLEAAFENVHAVARAGLAPAGRRVARPGAEITLREEPVTRAAVYVPGGRAPYPSTVVMGVAAARAAGVAEVVVCSPPRRGDIDPLVLGACSLSGATEVYRMGGAQAVAALALGTETVPRVEVIVGPGSLYVQEAKRQLSDRVGIDSFAGPSDLMVLAEALPAGAEPVALDLLAQAEHGAGTLVVAASSSEGVLDALQARLDGAPDGEAVLRLVHAPGAEEAVALAQAFAPEHLQLIGEAVEALAPRITRAGCLFVGHSAATAFGDYIAGSNHVLPTNGAARFASALSAATFRRRFSEVRVTDPTLLARAAAPLARAEGFEIHARSMESRIRQNRP